MAMRALLRACHTRRYARYERYYAICRAAAFITRHTRCRYTPPAPILRYDAPAAFLLWRAPSLSMRDVTPRMFIMRCADAAADALITAADDGAMPLRHDSASVVGALEARR